MQPVPVEDQGFWAGAWDVISSGGVTNVVTFLGVVVALVLAGKTARDRRRELAAEHEADARMIRVSDVGEGQSRRENDIVMGRSVGVRVENHSQVPVFDLRFRVWFDQPAASEENDRCSVLAPGDTLGGVLAVRYPEMEGLGEVPPSALRQEAVGWRLLWMDRYGNRWCVTEAEQTKPARFTKKAAKAKPPRQGVEPYVPMPPVPPSGPWNEGAAE